MSSAIKFVDIENVYSIIDFDMEEQHIKARPLIKQHHIQSF